MILRRMKKDAEMHAEEDKKRKEEVETINQAETIVFSRERLLKDLRARLTRKRLKM